MLAAATLLLCCLAGVIAAPTAPPALAGPYFPLLARPPARPLHNSTAATAGPAGRYLLLASPAPPFTPQTSRRLQRITLVLAIVAASPSATLALLLLLLACRGRGRWWATHSFPVCNHAPPAPPPSLPPRAVPAPPPAPQFRSLPPVFSTSLYGERADCVRLERVLPS